MRQHSVNGRSFAWESIPGFTQRALAGLVMVSSIWLLLPLTVFAKESITKSHGISTYGDLKYGPDFKHLNYVNPDAPKGGELSTANIGSFDSMHPYTIKGTHASLSTYFFESLMTGVADEPDALYGLLAESIEYPENRQWAIFNLRPEARFSDGTTVTAQDVVFTFNILLEKGIPSLKTVFSDFESVEALSPLRVKFTFREGAATKTLVSEAASLPVFSSAHWADLDFGDSTLVPGLGTGPYVLDELDVGRSVKLRLDDNYWGKHLPINVGRNNFQYLSEEYFADSNAAFEAFKAGQVLFRSESSSLKWATGYDFPAVDKKWVVKAEIPNGNLSVASGFYYNLRREKFTDIRVREALGLMFNFEWSNQTLFYGLYSRLDSFWENSDLEARGLPSPAELELLEPLAEFFPPSVLTEEAVVPKVSGTGQLDRKLVRKANKLLDAAGWKITNGVRSKNGQKLSVEFLIYSATFERIISPYIENLRRIGVEGFITRVDVSQYLERRGKHDFDILTSAYRTSLTPGLGLRQWFNSANAMVDSRNFAGLQNKGIDKLVELILAAQSREDMQTAVRALDRAMRSLRVMVPRWYNPNHTVAYWDLFGRPEDLPPYLLGEEDFWWYDGDKAEQLKSQGAL